MRNEEQMLDLIVRTAQADARIRAAFCRVRARTPTRRAICFRITM